MKATLNDAIELAAKYAQDGNKRIISKHPYGFTVTILPIGEKLATVYPDGSVSYD